MINASVFILTFNRIEILVKFIVVFWSHGLCINIVTINWNNYGNSDNYNKLYRAIKRNTSKEVRFYIFTDSSFDFDKNIIKKPLPVFKDLKKEDLKYAYQKEAGLCDDDLYGLNGERVFFFDDDSIILQNLDSVFELPKNDEFWILKDFNKTNNNKVGQATLYSWKVGTLGYIKEYFEKNPKEVINKYYTASQEYLSNKIYEKYGKLNYFPYEVCGSFKKHCIPRFFLLRFFIVPKKNLNFKIITFNGKPKIEDAVNGIWPEKKFFKKIYKHTLPTKWILEYWY